MLLHATSNSYRLVCAHFYNIKIDKIIVLYILINDYNKVGSKLKGTMSFTDITNNPICRQKIHEICNTPLTGLIHNYFEIGIKLLDNLTNFDYSKWCEGFIFFMMKVELAVDEEEYVIKMMLFDNAIEKKFIELSGIKRFIFHSLCQHIKINIFDNKYTIDPGKYAIHILDSLSNGLYSMLARIYIPLEPYDYTPNGIVLYDETLCLYNKHKSTPDFSIEKLMFMSIVPYYLRYEDK